MALSFGQGVRIYAWDGCSAGSNATIKESDARRDGRRGGYEPCEFILKPVFLLLAREPGKGKEGTYVEERGHVSRSLEG